MTRCAPRTERVMAFSDFCINSVDYYLFFKSTKYDQIYSINLKNIGVWNCWLFRFLNLRLGLFLVHLEKRYFFWVQKRKKYQYSNKKKFRIEFEKKTNILTDFLGFILKLHSLTNKIQHSTLLFYVEIVKLSAKLLQVGLHLIS